MMNKVVENIAEDQEICCFMPNNEGNYIQLLENCYFQLGKYLKENNLSIENILKQSIFVNVSKNNEYKEIKELISKLSEKSFGKFIPVSIIPQPPLPGQLISTEFLIFKNKNYSLEQKSYKNIKYLVSHFDDFKQVVVSSLNVERNITDIYQQCVGVFEMMQNILHAEGMDFSNVVRQWNYVENIVGYAGADQHYQIFNDVRSVFYNSSKFSDGYPSATGIGMSTGGFIIDFVAINNNSITKGISIKSPVQSDAHQYTREVLAKNTIKVGENETSPKFERAKALVSNGENCTIFISGTASIKGQHSIFENDAEKQTQFTIENILKLISQENIQKHGFAEFYQNLKPLYFRVYIKNAEDYSIVKNVCDKLLGKTKILYLQADICRPELLVEIEGIFSSHNQKDL